MKITTRFSGSDVTGRDKRLVHLDVFLREYATQRYV